MVRGFAVIRLARFFAYLSSQRQRFIEAARKAGATEDEDSFRQRLKAIAGANSAKGKEAKRPRKKRG